MEMCSWVRVESDLVYYISEFCNKNLGGHLICLNFRLRFFSSFRAFLRIQYYGNKLRAMFRFQSCPGAHSRKSRNFSGALIQGDVILFVSSKRRRLGGSYSTLQNKRIGVLPEFVHQAPVVQRLGLPIQRINRSMEQYHQNRGQGNRQTLFCISTAQKVKKVALVNNPNTKAQSPVQNSQLMLKDTSNFKTKHATQAAHTRT